MRVIHAPSLVDSVASPTVFLGGSIEGDTAVRWQDEVIRHLVTVSGTLLNPRRPAWDNSWETNIVNPVFREQVEWELSGIETSDIIVFYFDPTTRSPITLLELGLAIGLQKKIILACPNGFWRKGNVDIIAARHAIPVHTSLRALIRVLSASLTTLRSTS
jgi:Nucleoside 2-deoxyribosyltransferase like